MRDTINNLLFVCFKDILKFFVKNRAWFATSRGNINPAISKQLRYCYFFSFFELLVIIAALLILFTLTFPFLSQTMDIIRETGCKNLLLQINNANILYVADYGRYTAAAPNDRLRWHGKRINTGTRIKIYPNEGPLAAYYDFDMSGYMCPELKELLASHNNSKEKGGFGYGYNENIGSLRTKSILDLDNKYVKNSGIRYKDVKNPEKTVMFADTATKTDRSGDKNLNGDLAEFCFANTFFLISNRKIVKGICDPSLHFRHRGKANIAWADGHISLEPPTYTKDDWGKSNIGFIGSEKQTFFDPRINYAKDRR